MENEATLQQLFHEGSIRLQSGALFDVRVEPKRHIHFEKIEAMLLGLAIGDALGVTTESMVPAHRRMTYGEIRDYIPNRHVNECRGFPSDDTQMSSWTLEQMLEDHGFSPENVARKFATSGKIFGIGKTMRQFLANFKSGKPWFQSGPDSAGNGALMRIAPLLIPHLRTGGSAIWADTALAAMMTHNNYASTSCCLAFVAMLWDLLDMAAPPAKEWWVERYVELARDLEGDAQYEPRAGLFQGRYRGSLWRFVQEKIAWAQTSRLSVLEACNAWHSGAYLLETWPSVLYILMHHAHDPEEAIVRAVNDTKDNDTIASIVGAAVGALHGRLPQRWVRDLSGRTTDRDDGKVFELIERVRQVLRSCPDSPASFLL